MNMMSGAGKEAAERENLEVGRVRDLRKGDTG